MIERHEPHWISRAAFSALTIIFFITQATLGLAVYSGIFWLAVLIVLVSSHLMHGMLIGLHEASHGLLRKSRLLNEIDGIIIGVFGFMSFSLLPSGASIAPCALRHGARRGTLALRPARNITVRQNPCRRS